MYDYWLRLKYEKKIPLSSSRAYLHYFIVYPCGKQWGYMGKSYKMPQNYFLESRWVKLNSYCLTHNLSVGLCFFSKHNLWKLKDARLTILYLFFTKAKCLKPISTGGVSSNDTVFFRLDDFRLLLRRRWLFLWSGFFYETDWTIWLRLWVKLRQ